MSDTEPAFYWEHRAAFEGRLGTLGFVRQHVGNEDGRRYWVGLVRAVWHDPVAATRKSSAHSVRIALGKGFPFQKPEVTPLDEDVPIVGQRHQAPGGGGALCLYADDGKGWLPEHTADDLIGRIREWFVHYHRNDWPDHDRAPDLHLYFSAVAGRPMMVYGEDWKPPTGHTFGRFGVWQNSPRRAFAGSPTAGDVSPKQEHDDPVLPVLGLASVARDRVGLWFRLSSEPKPHHTLGELFAEIDRLRPPDARRAREAVRALMGDKVRDRRQSRLTIALGYPDPSGQEQWLFLQTEMLPSGKNRRWSRSGDAIPVGGFSTAPATKATLMRRTSHTARLLHGKKVLLFGTGAIGSSVALLLAKAGIDALILVDGDRIRPGNAVRNAAGLGYVGTDKAWAVSAEVRQHAPHCIVTPIGHESWDPHDLAQVVLQADVVVDATANEPFSLLLNHACLRAKKRAVYVTAHRKAAIGRVRLVRPGVDACKFCYDYEITQHNDYPVIPIGDEGEFTEGGCGTPTVEASAIDIEASANLAARTVLHLLRDKQGAQNECILVNEPLDDGPEIFLKSGTTWFQRPPAAGCIECGGRHG